MNDAIGARLAAVRRQVGAAAVAAGRDPLEITLLAVSKNHPTQDVRAAHAAGQRDFGENRVQELTAKASQLTDLPGLRWHMIGSLQTNKVRDLLDVPGLALLHSLDRVRLADELQRQLAGQGRSLEVLLQVHATDEASKHGCPIEVAEPLLRHVSAQCPSLRVMGLMAMGPLGGDPAPVFAAVVALRDRLQAVSGLPLAVLSLGMSDDFVAAIAAGSTMVRLGTVVFGARG